MGRRKIDITEVKDPSTKQVTFSKRRTGLFKKANELSILCGADVAIVVFSPGNKPYSYAHPSVDVVANRYLREQNAPDVDEDADADDDGVADMDMLNQQLSDLEAQIRKEEKKGKNLSEKLKRFEEKKVSQSTEEMKTSYSKFQDKVDDYLVALEVAEYMLLLSQEPVVGVPKQVSKKRKKN